MIYDKAHELAKAFKCSPDYRQYQESKKEVSANKENLKILQEFHTKQLEIQTMQMLGQEIPAEKMKEYEQMAELLQLNPSVKTFLQAEYRIMQTFADVQKILAEALNLELPKSND